jgi:phosphate transport system ATP-binding protein
VTDTTEIIETDNGENELTGSGSGAVTTDASTRAFHLTGGPPPGAATLETRGACAWFGDHLVLEDVDLTMQANQVTALIGPSGCGKSTYLRLLNRMHELVPGAALAGEILLDGEDIYRPGIRAQQVRMRIGMVFQKPNPFPAMSIRDNVLAGLKLARIRCSDKDALVEQILVTGWVRRAARSPADSNSGSASPARSRCSPTCCSWTSPAPPSTPRRQGASRRRSTSCESS